MTPRLRASSCKSSISEWRSRVATGRVIVLLPISPPNGVTMCGGNTTESWPLRGEDPLCLPASEAKVWQGHDTNDEPRRGDDPLYTCKTGGAGCDRARL